VARAIAVFSAWEGIDVNRRLICMFSIAALAAASAAPAATTSSAAPAATSSATSAATSSAAPGAAGQTQATSAGQASSPATGTPAAGVTPGAAGVPPDAAGAGPSAGGDKPALGPLPEPVHDAMGSNMARYYMVFLRRSGKPAATAAENRKVMEGHLDNIRKLAAERKLLLAGPFMDQSGPGSLAGIFILATASAEEARQLAAGDPAVAAGRFTFEILPWMGPKSLVRVLEPQP
jgi:uncharacterized protein YciI